MMVIVLFGIMVSSLFGIPLFYRADASLFGTAFLMAWTSKVQDILLDLLKRWLGGPKPRTGLLRGRSNTPGGVAVCACWA